MSTSPCPAAPTPTSRACSPSPRNWPTQPPAPVPLRNWPATTRFSPNETAFVPSSPDPPPQLRRWASLPTRWTVTASSSQLPRPASPPPVWGVLADARARDAQQLSAPQTRQQALADADHLAVLHAIWTDQTAPAPHQPYRDLLLAAPPPQHAPQPH